MLISCLSLFFHVYPAISSELDPEVHFKCEKCPLYGAYDAGEKEVSATLGDLADNSVGPLPSQYIYTFSLFLSLCRSYIQKVKESKKIRERERDRDLPLLLFAYFSDRYLR